MVIYNHKKEFVGIEKKDLKALNLTNLAELQQEASDFADLFVKAPGYIHNFKYVHWIDFIASADSIDENRAVISVKGRKYRATIELQPLYLVDEPEKEAYGVILNGIRELTAEEHENLGSGIDEKEAPKPKESVSTPSAAPLKEAPSKESESIKEEQIEIKPEPVEEEPLSLELEIPEVKEEEAPLEIALDEEEETPSEQVVEYVLDEDDKFHDYHYDPEIVAKELGLPSDLVEEFVQDFIAQAREFKPDLYEALDTGRIDNLRMLSHKLKGVAANLRMEDAYEALVTINTSDDIDLVKRTLDHFYMVILRKLAGEEVKVVTTPKPKAPQNEQPQQEEMISLDLDEGEMVLEAPEEARAQEPQQEDDKIELVLDDEESAVESEASISATEPQEDKLELALDLDEQEEHVPELTLDDEEHENNKPAQERVEEEPPLEISLIEEETTQEIAEKTEPESIVLDKEHIASELGIDIEVYEELLGDYVSDMHGGLAQLEEAIANGDDESAKKLAVRLKGMSDNMHLGMIAEELERFIKDESTDRAASLNKIKTEIDSIERI